jgi:hypothetical protein
MSKAKSLEQSMAKSLLLGNITMDSKDSLGYSSGIPKLIKANHISVGDIQIDDILDDSSMLSGYEGIPDDLTMRNEPPRYVLRSHSVVDVRNESKKKEVLKRHVSLIVECVIALRVSHRIAQVKVILSV